MKILILGANGFIGSHLSEALLAQTPAEIIACDLSENNLSNCLTQKKFHFEKRDITRDTAWVTEQIKQADIIFPLVAIATPAMYVQNPLRVFELDFEANLAIVRQCVEFKKHVVFPSTSEVYGMCPDAAFDEEESNLVTGPIHKERWIYSTCKQLMDRVIFAYGKHRDFTYTLFRPFNWYGPRLDNIFNPQPGGSRVLTQFIGNILRGENIMLVNGGKQQRCFLHVHDGIQALVKIVQHRDNHAKNKIFNVGNPSENISIRQLAEILIRLIQAYPNYADAARKTQLVDVSGEKYFGAGYQDVSLRVPSIKRAQTELNWNPQVNLETGLKQTLDFYLLEQQVALT